MSKLRMPALIVVIIIQLFAPAYMIANKYYIINTGEEFRFRVSPVDPSDAFRGRYVALNAAQSGEPLKGRYGILAVGADGFAEIASATDKKPSSGSYVKSSDSIWFILPINRYYMDEKLAPEAELLTRRVVSEKETFVTVRVKNGELVITGLFVGGVAIEEAIINRLQ